jgi:hypothetical protein
MGDWDKITAAAIIKFENKNIEARTKYCISFFISLYI